MLLIGATRLASAEVTFRGRTDRPDFPPGTDVVPFELRHGLIHFRATLRGPSGQETSGYLVLDTGAPTLSLKPRIRALLRLDTLERISMTRSVRRRLPLTVALGERTQTELVLQSEIPDTLLGPEVLGLFGPDLIRDKGILVDYARRRWAIVPRRPAVVQRDTSRLSPGQDLGQRARIQQSRSAFASVLGPTAIAVPVRMHEGGRILVRAHLEDVRDGWRSQALTLLVDTGASSCGVFADLLERHGQRTRSWPWLRDIMVHTVLGRFTTDLALVPRLGLPDAASPLRLDRVETAADHRDALPSLDDEVGVPVHGHLGYTFLGRFKVLFDVLQGVMWLEPVADAGLARFRHSHVGIQLEQRWGSLRVAAVARGSPADRAGVSVGDVLVSVDGRSVRAMEPERVEELLQGPAGTEVAVVLRTENGERVLRLKREQLL